MNSWLFVASALAVLTGLAHSYLGERYILIRLLRRTDLPQLFGSDVFTKRTLRFAWHLTSIAWVGAAVSLWVLARGDAPGGIRVLSATFFVTALVIAAGSRGQHLAWLVFLAIGVAAWLGASAP